MSSSVLAHRAAKPAVGLLCLLPLAGLLLRGSGLGGGSLGADPVVEVIHALGLWGLRLLLLTLCLTPLRFITGSAQWLRFRRLLGLLAFFYLSLHVLAYVAIDQGLEVARLWEDVVKRRWITIGLLAYGGLLPLAVTSTRGWMRRLGRRWVVLHRLVYVAAALGCWHFALAVKKDLRTPLAYAACFVALMGWRGWRAARRSRTP